MLQYKIYMKQILPISKEEMTKRYFAKVDQVCEDIDWKTTFGPEEICDMIYDILEKSVQLKNDGWHPIIYCGVKTVNDHVYEIENIEDQMEDLEERALHKNMGGQMGYPINSITNNLEPVDLSNVSHIVSGVQFEDGILWAKIDPIDSPKGRQLKAFMELDLVEFTHIAEGEIEERHGTKYVRVDKIIGVHAILKEPETNTNNE